MMRAHMHAQQDTKRILNNKGTVGGITIPDFMLYYRDIAVKIAWYCLITSDTFINVRIEDLDISIHTQGTLHFEKEARNTHRIKGKKTNKFCWSNLIDTCRKMKLEYHF